MKPHSAHVPTSDRQGDPPLISVIVPTHNRPRPLQACLAALAASTHPRDLFEVIIVDDGGDAPLDSLIRELPDDLTRRLVRQDRSGPAAARNAGAALAKGSLLAFTDDDCLPEPGWLDALARAARAHPGHLIGGATVNVLPENVFSAASQHLVSYLYEYGARRTPESDWSPFFTSNNLAVPAEGFSRVGGFDAGFPLAAGEDRDFCDRWAAHGLPMVYEPDARVGHAHRLTFRSFCRQHWNYGRGAFHFHQARTARGDSPLRPQPTSFYLDLVRFPFAHERLGRALPAAALLALSQGVNAFGYFLERLMRAGPAPRRIADGDGPAEP